MSAAELLVLARYNVRPLLADQSDALLRAVSTLGIPTHQLPALAQHGSVEAIAVEGLAGEQSRALYHAALAVGGYPLFDATAQRAVVLAPIAAVSALPQHLPEIAADLGAAISAMLTARSTQLAVTARGYRVDIAARTAIMGIVNVTPDSFAGDGVGEDVGRAVERALQLADEGADIIDIGGESTRPNSSAVSEAEELRRVLPVLRALAGRLHVPVSIDTHKPAVAAAAIDEGAAIVNDIWGLRAEPGMAQVVAQHPEVALVAMHNQRGVDYMDLMAEVSGALRQSLALAAEAGIDPERVIIDPGFGFAKTPAQNLELLRRLGELRGIGRPILVGPSRKSTVGFLVSPDDTPARQEERLEGSLALATLAAANGAGLVRVHDLAATRRALLVADAVIRGTPQHVVSLPAPGPTG